MPRSVCSRRDIRGGIAYTPHLRLGVRGGAGMARSSPCAGSGGTSCAPWKVIGRSAAAEPASQAPPTPPHQSKTGTRPTPVVGPLRSRPARTETRPTPGPPVAVPSSCEVGRWSRGGFGRDSKPAFSHPVGSVAPESTYTDLCTLRDFICLLSCHTRARWCVRESRWMERPPLAHARSGGGRGSWAGRGRGRS